jgi:hypothetical protein
MKPSPDIRRVIAAYKMNGSLRKTALVLKLSFWKTRELLKASGFQVKPRGGFSHKGKLKMKPRGGAFARWLRANPGVKLPLNLEEIATLTGCSKNAIKCSLYRLRKKGKKIPLLRKRRHFIPNESAPTLTPGTTSRRPLSKHTPASSSGS